jgi:hypothetical protein
MLCYKDNYEGNYNKCIDYLHRIINDQIDLRVDLHCYARLLHLIAHFEMGNYDLIEYLTKSVYRFMSKMKHLTIIEEEMFKFLRMSFQIPRSKLKAEFEILMHTLKQYEKSRFETRSFAYLDIISWLESKVYEKPMAFIINEKFEKSKH